MPIQTTNLIPKGAPGAFTKVVMSSAAYTRLNDYVRRSAGSGRRETVGALVGTAETRSREAGQLFNVRDVIPVPFATNDDHASIPPDEWRRVEEQIAASNQYGGKPRLIGWFYADSAMGASPPRLDIDGVQRGLPAGARLFLLVNASTDEGAFCIWQGKSYRPLSGFYESPASVPAGSIIPWGGSVLGAAEWLGANSKIFAGSHHTQVNGGADKATIIPQHEGPEPDGRDGERAAEHGTTAQGIAAVAGAVAGAGAANTPGRAAAAGEGTGAADGKTAWLPTVHGEERPAPRGVLPPQARLQATGPGSQAGLGSTAGRKTSPQSAAYAAFYQAASPAQSEVSPAGGAAVAQPKAAPALPPAPPTSPMGRWAITAAAILSGALLMLLLVLGITGAMAGSARSRTSDHSELAAAAGSSPTATGTVIASGASGDALAAAGAGTVPTSTATSTLEAFPTVIAQEAVPPPTPTPSPVITATPSPEVASALPTRPADAQQPTLTPRVPAARTNTTTLVPTRTFTPVPRPSATSRQAAPTNTSLPALTHTPVRVPTNTPVPPTHTGVPALTNTPIPGATHTAVPSPTRALTVTPSFTPVPPAPPSSTPRPTNTPQPPPPPPPPPPTDTPRPNPTTPPTNTPVPTAVPTDTPQPTSPPIDTPRPTSPPIDTPPVPTNTPRPTRTPRP